MLPDPDEAEIYQQIRAEDRAREPRGIGPARYWVFGEEDPDNALTDTGFTWDAIKVDRIASFREGYHVVRVTTQSGVKVEVYVSPKGRKVHVYQDNRELT